MTNIKELQTERDNLMSVINEKDAFINKIKAWLTDEVAENQDVVDAQENGDDYVTSDGTDDIIIGRHECAEGLLNQIEKWENE